MKGKTLSAALVSMGLLAAPAAFAASGDAQMLVDHSAAAVQRAQADGQFARLLAQAKGVVIVPDLMQGAVGIGGAGGDGVVLARRGGHWSDPAFVSIAAVSVGPQLGGKSGPMVMLLMTNRALNDITANNNFSLKADAGLTVQDYSQNKQAGIGQGDVVVWSGAGGAYIGASVGGADITADNKKDANYYGKPVGTHQIIDGLAHSAQADNLRRALPG